MSILGKALQKRATPPLFGDSSIPPNSSLGAPTSTGLVINDQAAMKVSAFMACVRIISGALAGRPMKDVVWQGGIQVPIPPPLIITDPFGGANTSRWPSRREGFKQLAISLLLRGNGYARITARDYLLRPTRLMVLHPDAVKVEADEENGRAYKVNRQPVDAIDMVHLIGMSFPGALTGMSPVAYARESIALALAAEQFGGAFFGQGAHLSGVIEVEADLDKPAARRMKESFEASHSGMRNAHAIGILSGGATWKPISISPEDAQFLGTRAAQNLDMAMLMGVPPHMLGQVDRTTSWGTGIEQQNLGFLTWTLDDWLQTFEDPWTGMLPRGQCAVFDTGSLLRTDTAGRYAAYVQGRTGGFITTNEIRARENMPPVDGGDDIAAPLNSAHTDTPPPTGDPGPDPTKGE